MTFETPQEALRVLGLDGHATRDDIKSAYHKLASVYHPDARETQDEDGSAVFIMIQSAYDYLMDAYDKALEEYVKAQTQKHDVSNTVITGTSPGASEPKIIGNAGAMRAQAVNRHFAQERLKQEKRLEKARKQKQREVDERLAQYKEDMEYEKAMREIHAIRAAEITLRLYEASLKGPIGREN